MKTIKSLNLTVCLQNNTTHDSQPKLKIIENTKNEFEDHWLAELGPCFQSFFFFSFFNMYEVQVEL